VLEDAFEHTSLIVGGAIQARGIKCGARILSGGPIRAEVVVVDLDGNIGGPAGIEPEMVIVEDDGAELHGKVKAKNMVDGDEMMMGNRTKSIMLSSYRSCVRMAFVASTPLRGFRHLIVDRDPLYTSQFRQLLATASVDLLRLPAKSPT
jgi:hypothetical protein